MKKRSKQSIWFIFLLFTGMTVLGKAAPLPEGDKTLSPSSYHYEPKGKPDPFKPFVEKEVVPQKQKAKKAPLSIFPLLRIPLDDIKLVGIAEDGKKRLAIVETKEGDKQRSYPVYIGTMIGINRGKVVEIARDRLIIEEVREAGTRRKVTKIVKKLHSDEEEVIP